MKSIVKILFIIIVAGLSSCLTEPDCLSPTTDFANALFYKSEDNQLDTVFVNSLTVLGSEDSVLVTNTDVTRMILPLRPDTTAVTFIFDSELGLDTLVVNYAPRSRLVSEECGIDIIFAELSSSRQTFDSVTFENTTLIEDINEDIRIFN